MQNSQLTPFDQQPSNELISNPKVEPVRLADVARQMGIANTQIKAEQLKDKTFVILRARPFESSFKDQEHAYFCTIQPLDVSERYSVVLGGGAVVEMLDAYIAANIDAPLEVTLRYAEGKGKFAGYYYFDLGGEA